MNQYKSKDIYKITGLSRSQVNDYSDVIIPVAYETSAMHKLYDETSLRKFKEVAIYKHFGVSRKTIKKYIADEEDIQKVLFKQIDSLKGQAKACEKLLKKLSRLVKLDLEEFFNQENNESFRKFLEAEKE